MMFLQKTLSDSSCILLGKMQNKVFISDRFPVDRRICIFSPVLNLGSAGKGMFRRDGQQDRFFSEKLIGKLWILICFIKERKINRGIF